MCKHLQEFKRPNFTNKLVTDHKQMETLYGVYLFTSVGMAGPKGAQTRFIVINTSILYVPTFTFLDYHVAVDGDP